MSDSDSSVEILSPPANRRQNNRAAVQGRQVIDLLSSSSDEEERQSRRGQQQQPSATTGSAARKKVSSVAKLPAAAAQRNVRLGPATAVARKPPPTYQQQKQNFRFAAGRRNSLSNMGKSADDAICPSSSDDDDDVVPIVQNRPLVPVGVVQRGKTKEFAIPIYADASRRLQRSSPASKKKRPAAAKRKHHHRGSSDDDEEAEDSKASGSQNKVSSTTASSQKLAAAAAARKMYSYNGMEVDSSDDELTTVIELNKLAKNNKRRLDLSRRPSDEPRLNREETKQARRQKAAQEERRRGGPFAQLSPLRKGLSVLSPSARGRMGPSAVAGRTLALSPFHPSAAAKRPLPSDKQTTPSGPSKLRVVPRMGRSARAMNRSPAAATTTAEVGKKTAAAALPSHKAPPSRRLAAAVPSKKAPLQKKGITSILRPPRPPTEGTTTNQASINKEGQSSRSSLHDILNQDDHSMEGGGSQSPTSASEAFDDEKLPAKKKPAVLSRSKQEGLDESQESDSAAVERRKRSKSLESDSSSFATRGDDDSEGGGTVAAEEDFGFDVDDSWNATFGTGFGDTVKATASTSTSPPPSFDFDDDSVVLETDAPSPLHLRQRVVDEPKTTVSAILTKRLSVITDYEESSSGLASSVEDYETQTEDQSSLDEDDELQNLELMNVVEHLSKRNIDNRGYPVFEFTTFFLDRDNELYYFRVDIRDSTIPGAGRGAFLTFLGKRRLPVDLVKKAEKLCDEREVFRNKTLEPLTGRTAVGTEFSVVLTGQNLHGNNNNIRWPKKMMKLFLTNMDYDSYTEENMAVEDGIGALGIYKESSYEKVAGKFPPKDKEPTCMYLGGYGPFLKSDRKPESLFTMKSFIFNKFPDSWAFDVDEKLFGELQTIDITSDTYGAPHDAATKQIAMYVNETGHSGRKKNVCICHHNDRSVHYYIKIYSEMMKGEPVELLTDYGRSYEHVRERKGYGLKNLHEGLKSDTDPIKSLELSLVDREDTENVERDLCCAQLVDHIEFTKEVWDTVRKSCSSFLASPHDTPKPSRFEWIAMRRIFWLRDIFSCQIERIEQEKLRALGVPTLDETAYPFKASFAFCHESLAAMRWPFSFDDLRDSDRPDDEFSVVEILRQEIASELLYDLSSVILMPLDESVWCPTAACLMRSLSRSLADAVLSAGPDGLSQKNKQRILSSWFEMARSHVGDIRKACSDGKVPDDLTFASGVEKGCVRAPLHKLLSAFKCSKSFFMDYRCTPKGFIAAASRKLAYIDALAAAGIEPQLSRHDVELKASERYVMVEVNLPQEDAGVSRLASLPEPTSSLPKTSARINETWYLTWQVAYIVYAFVSAFMDGVDTSLEQLCDEIQVDLEPVQFAVARGMQMENYKELRQQCIQNGDFKPTVKHADSGDAKRGGSNGRVKRERTKSSNKKRTANACSKLGGGGRPPAKLVAEGLPIGQFPLGGVWPAGWTWKQFQRQSGETKGDFDNYWYTPEKEYKLRSLKEVQRYCTALKATNGNEEEAWRKFKGR